MSDAPTANNGGVRDSKGRFVNGNPGRHKGAVNVIGREVGAKILNSLAELDALKDEDGKLLFAQGYLVHLALTKPESYVSALKAVLPRDVNLSGDVAVTLEDCLLRVARGAVGPEVEKE